MQYLDITDVELFFYYLIVDVIVLCCYFISAWKNLQPHRIAHTAKFARKSALKPSVRIVIPHFRKKNSDTQLDARPQTQPLHLSIGTGGGDDNFKRAVSTGLLSLRLPL
jgi:hypothetical protein